MKLAEANAAPRNSNSSISLPFIFCSYSIRQISGSRIGKKIENVSDIEEVREEVRLTRWETVTRESRFPLEEEKAGVTDSC